MKKKFFVYLLSTLYLIMLLPSQSFATDTSVATLITMKAAAAGESHSVAVDKDGNVWTWGYNSYGQLGDGSYISKSSPQKISGIKDIIAVGCGATHSLVVKDDGSVWAWGYNYDGRPAKVEGISDVKAVTGGRNHSVALKKDGTVWTWGRNAEGQLGRAIQNNQSNIPGKVVGLDNVIAIVSVENLSAALKNDGTVWVWGELNGIIDTPICEKNLDNVSSIAIASETVVAAKKDGTVWVGSKQIEGLKDVCCLSSGQYYFSALEKDGSLWICGKMHDYSDSTWMRANGKFDNPVKVEGSTDVQALAGGYNHLIFINKDGLMWAVGNNKRGQLGDGIFINRSIPVKVRGLEKVNFINSSYRKSCAILDDGTVYIWGYMCNNGRENGGYNNTPTKISLLNNSTFINATSTAYFGMKNDNTIYKCDTINNLNLSNIIGLDGVKKISYGDNYFTVISAIDSTDKILEWTDNDLCKTPKVVKGISDVADVCMGYNNTLALKKDGTVYSWSSYEILPDVRKSDYQITPLKVQGLNGITAISANDRTCLALKNDGTVWKWNVDNWGNLKTSKLNTCIPTKISRLTNIIAVSGANTALKSDGTVWSWGSNSEGQLGDGTMVDKEEPVQVHGLENVIKISSCANHSLALKSDGSVWTWGADNEGQLGVGTQLFSEKPVLCMTYSNNISNLPNLIKVTVDDKPLIFDVLPTVADRRTLVPMRLIFESLGANVKWDSSSQTVTGVKGDKTIALKIGSNEASVNGVTKVLDVPAISLGGRTLVPIRFISESLDANVNWDEYTNTIIISSK